MFIDLDGNVYGIDVIAIALRYAASDVNDPDVRAALLIAAVALEGLAEPEA